MLYLRFAVVGGTGASSPLTLTRVRLNEATPTAGPQGEVRVVDDLPKQN